MAENNMTYAESSQILEAVKVLEALEASGEITSSEQSALDKFRNKAKSAEQAKVETISTYRGAQAGATMNFADEIAGAYGAATELFKSGDIEGARQSTLNIAILSGRKTWLHSF
jgi:TolA-binding protein